MIALSIHCRVLSGVLAGVMLLAAPSVASAQSSPSSFTSGTRYDASRRVVGTIAPDPDGSGALKYAATRNTYDAAGRLVAVESGELAAWQSESVLPSAWSGFAVFKRIETGYDALGRKVVERVYDVQYGGTQIALTQYSYTGLDRLECTAVRMNPAAFGSLPGSACSLGTAGSDGPDRITRNVYDAAGQVLKVQKAYGTPLQQDYATYEYTPNGKQKAVIDANGNRAELAWDGHDRQSVWRFPDKTSVGTASASDYEAYGYDSNGNRTDLRKRDGRTISYAYDAANRVTAKTYPSGGAFPVYYGYDLRGLQTSARYSSQSGADAVLAAWDGFGRQTSTTTTMGGASRTLNFTFDANGNRTGVVWPDATLAYGYDDLDRLASVKEGGTYQVYGVSYDARGLPANSGLRAGTGTDSSGYYFDGTGRLSGRSTVFVSDPGYNYYLSYDYAYNAASQLTSRARYGDAYAFGGYVNVSRGYQKNGLNQYTQAGNLTLGYDANGNLTSDSITGYVYDIENRLIQGGGTYLTWDPLGRLWQVSASSGTTQFLYDGDQLAGEYNAGGTLLRRYAHGQGEDDPLIWYEGSGLGDRRALHADHQGSIVAVSSGTGVTPYAYDEYGIPGANQTGRFQYTGQAWIPELGMYHYKARFYSPTLGRFLQTDPIGYDDQINLYAYVGNDPVNNTDSTGMEGEDIVVTARRVWRAAVSITTTPIPRVHVDLPKPVVAAAQAVGISEQCAESTSTEDCTAGEMATGLGLAVAAIGLPELIGSEALAGTLGIAPRALSAAERNGIKSLFSSGPKGADAFLKAVKGGQITRLPPGVTRATLRVYIARVVARGVQGKGSQVARLEGIRVLLSRNVK